MSAKRLTPEFIQAVVAAYEGGMSFTELCEEFQASKGTISLALAGVPKRGHKRTRRPTATLIPTPCVRPSLSLKQRGDAAELTVMAEFARLGFTVLIPFGDKDRYDLVLDTTSGFVTVQVKHAAKNPAARNGFVMNTSSLRKGATGWDRRDYRGDVDYLVGYHPESGTLVMVTPEEVGSRKQAFVVEAAVNHPKVRKASDYTIEATLSKYQIHPRSHS